MILSFAVITALAQANMGPPPDIAPPCMSDTACGAAGPGQTCAHPPQQDPPCPALAEAGLVHTCTVALPDLEGNHTSVYCNTPATPPPAEQATPPPPASTRRCGAASAAAVVPLVLLGLWRREDVSQL